MGDGEHKAGSVPGSVPIPARAMGAWPGTSSVSCLAWSLPQIQGREPNHKEGP
jgi:hypothetical protein